MTDSRPSRFHHGPTAVHPAVGPQLMVVAPLGHTEGGQVALGPVVVHGTDQVKVHARAGGRRAPDVSSCREPGPR